MTIKELIKKLEDIEHRYGDITVYCRTLTHLLEPELSIVPRFDLDTSLNPYYLILND